VAVFVKSYVVKKHQGHKAPQADFLPDSDNSFMGPNVLEGKHQLDFFLHCSPMSCSQFIQSGCPERTNIVALIGLGSPALVGFFRSAK